VHHRSGWGRPHAASAARVAARCGAIYAMHVHSETGRLFEAMAEAIEIGKQAEIRVQISHIKLEGCRNRVLSLEEAVKKMTSATAERFGLSGRVIRETVSSKPCEDCPLPKANR
jgi:N-acyl-D-aspartate/D-glutamate deacylase